MNLTGANLKTHAGDGMAARVIHLTHLGPEQEWNPSRLIEGIFPGYKLWMPERRDESRSFGVLLWE